MLFQNDFGTTTLHIAAQVVSQKNRVSVQIENDIPL